ncbi:MAG: class II aldolase/adducin family protein [Ignisphaera sp.]|nr:class II aldolase/adducin family protein [Ignisphaera sp.]MDW8085696.1 class II aldolase/adducin family protein [Ignisphaera sp.]
MSENSIDFQIREEILTVMRNLYRRGLVSALTGNVSVRVPGTDAFWITPTGIFKGGLRHDDLIKMNICGDLVDGRNRPSSEWRFHAAIYKVRQDVNAVIHAHNPVTLALNIAGIRLDLSLLSEALLFIKGVEYVPYVEPGSEELANRVLEKAQLGVNIIVLERHGIIAMGRNIYEAQTIAETIEDLATVQLVSRLARFLYTLG